MVTSAGPQCRRQDHSRVPWRTPLPAVAEQPAEVVQLVNGVEQNAAPSAALTRSCHGSRDRAASWAGNRRIHAGPRARPRAVNEQRHTDGGWKYPQVEADGEQEATSAPTRRSAPAPRRFRARSAFPRHVRARAARAARAKSHDAPGACRQAAGSRVATRQHSQTDGDARDRGRFRQRLTSSPRQHIPTRVARFRQWRCPIDRADNDKAHYRFRHLSNRTTRTRPRPC